MFVISHDAIEDVTCLTGLNILADNFEALSFGFFLAGPPCEFFLARCYLTFIYFTKVFRWASTSQASE